MIEEPITPHQQTEQTSINPQLAQWLAALQNDIREQTKLLQSIKSGVTFFVVITILSMILGACTVLGFF